MASTELPPSEPLLSVQGSVATITLNRPAHRNRLERADLHALLRHFAHIDADPSIRVLKLSANTQGQPRPVFCAGFHIGSFDSDTEDQGLFERVADALAMLRPVTVCALNGSVYGGATDLMLACDLCVALAGIEFRMPAAALGLHYYPSGLQRYVARLGLSGAKRAFLSARHPGGKPAAHGMPGGTGRCRALRQRGGALGRGGRRPRAARGAVHQALAQRDRRGPRGHRCDARAGGGGSA